MLVTISVDQFDCRSSERNCATPKLKCGGYHAALQQMGRRYRLVLRDGTIIPVDKFTDGIYVAHMKPYACEFYHTTANSHYNGDCPSGPTTCTSNDKFETIDQVELIVRPELARA